jgi:anti-sigma regulatory factor (Ser/Thr protein kinase)
MSTTHEHIGTRHHALVYHDAAEFVDGAGGFARDGLGEEEHVLAVAMPEKLAWLREELGGDGDALELVDAREFYDRHGPMFQSVLGQLERHATPGRGRLRLIAEHPLTLRQPADVRDYMRYEAAGNIAYDRYDVSVLCPYDAGQLPDEIVHAALETHPHVLEGDATRPSELFRDPRSYVRQCAVETTAPVGAAALLLEQAEDLATARTLIREQGNAAGLGSKTVEDLTLAVTEVATNALVHGDAPRCLWSYVEDDHLVCQVRDAGSGLMDPLAGYLPPDAAGLSGRGLWLAHQLCDIVEVASHTTQTNVYLHARLPAAA